MEKPYILLDQALLNELYSKYGLTIRELGTLFHCSPDTIRRRLIEAGIPRRSHRKDIPLDDLRFLRQKGWTLEQLAHKYACTAMTISNRLHQ